MTDLPVAALRFLDRENARLRKDANENRLAQERLRAEKLKRWKHAILKEEVGAWYCRRDYCMTIGLIICLFIPVLGWMMIPAFCMPCNIHIMKRNRQKVLAAACRGEDALEALSDLENDDMHFEC